jgi:DNA-binding NarL/FixJ family response regulator
VNPEALDRLFDRAADWPSPPNRSSASVIEVAHKHIGGILGRWPMAPDTLHKHLTALHEELGAYAPTLDTARITREFLDIADIPTPRTLPHVHKPLTAEQVDAVEAIAATRTGTPPPEPVLRLVMDCPVPHYTLTNIADLASGRSTSDIAKDDRVATATIKTRMAVAARDMGIPNVHAAIVVEAARRGWIHLAPTGHPAGTLTGLQTDIVQRLANGDTYIRIAADLDITERVIKTRLSGAAAALGARVNHPLIVSIAYANGWIT